MIMILLNLNFLLLFTVHVDLNGLFEDFQILSMEETSLSANQKLSEQKKWFWNSDNVSVLEEEEQGHNQQETFVITLVPMQIRTFLMKVNFT